MFFTHQKISWYLIQKDINWQILLTDRGSSGDPPPTKITGKGSSLTLTESIASSTICSILRSAALTSASVRWLTSLASPSDIRPAATATSEVVRERGELGAAFSSSEPNIRASWNGKNQSMLKGMYAVWICYGRKLKVTQMRMCNTHKSICLWCILGLMILTHAQSLAIIQNMKVDSRVTFLSL